ncbi:hypothetical protein, partial [Methylobacterium radiotolerans]|uniref:hypothetical protein n=1 Tax=Methylobacterium radiotolerans TaxID=31998 RepID=UPI000B923984
PPHHTTPPTPPPAARPPCRVLCGTVVQPVGEAERGLALDVVPALIGAHDVDLTTRSANAAHATWTGQTAAAVVGRTVRDRLGPGA